MKMTFGDGEVFSAGSDTFALRTRGATTNISQDFRSADITGSDHDGNYLCVKAAYAEDGSADVEDVYLGEYIHARHGSSRS